MCVRHWHSLIASGAKRTFGVAWRCVPGELASLPTEGGYSTQDVAEGWEPLCAFLGKAVPDAPFPRTNATHQFWESVGDVMPPPIDV